MRIDPTDYEALDLRAHSLLAEVPLHDVWRVELPGGRPGLTMPDVRSLLSPENLTEGSAAARILFRVRGLLGRFFRWDRRSPTAVRGSFLERLSEADRQASLVAPGTPEGPFQVLLVTPREAIAEIQNATVHAFSVFAFIECVAGYRLFWAIYVMPVGGITAWYMRLIDPFRRFIVYPAALRQIRRAWARSHASAA